MLNKMLAAIEAAYPLAQISAGEFAKMKVNGMKFEIRAFQAQGLGHVSVMRAKGVFGLMQMDTLIITPTLVDLPLLSYDRVLVMGNDTLIYELYDTLLVPADLCALEAVKQNAAALPEHDLGEHWYDSIKLPVSFAKKGKKQHTAAFDAAAMEYLQQYLACAKTATPAAAEQKLLKASVYTEGLLLHGGPSTDAFKKAIGAEKTGELFRTVLFGTGA